MYVAQLLAIVGAGILAQPIGKLFDAPSETVWFGAAINILNASLGPPASQAADYWGRRWLLIGFAVCGCVGAIIISRAQNMGTAIAGFAVMSMASGGLSLMHAVVSEVLPRKIRPTAQATINTTAGVGAVAGLLTGGALVKDGNLENYRTYWYIIAGVYICAVLGIFAGYNPPKRHLEVSLTMREKIHSLDSVGYLLLPPGLVLASVALSWYRNPYAFANVRILTTFIIGVTMLILFAFYEWRFKKDGMFHHGLFSHRNYLISLIGIFTEGAAVFAANTYFSFEVSLFKDPNTFMVGFNYSILFIGTIFFSPMSGFWSSKMKSLRAPAMVGFLGFLVFNILMATSSQHTSRAAFWAYPILAGIGLGVLLPTLVVIAQLSTPRDLISIASGLLISTRAFGGTIGLAIYNAIFNSTLSSNIPTKIASVVLPLGLPSTSLGALISALTANDEEALANVPGITPQMIPVAGAALMDAYSVAFRNIWITAAGFSAFALICKCSEYFHTRSV